MVNVPFAHRDSYSFLRATSHCSASGLALASATVRGSSVTVASVLSAKLINSSLTSEEGECVMDATIATAHSASSSALPLSTLSLIDYRC